MTDQRCEHKIQAFRENGRGRFHEHQFGCGFRLETNQLNLFYCPFCGRETKRVGGLEMTVLN